MVPPYFISIRKKNIQTTPLGKLIKTNLVESAIWMKKKSKPTNNVCPTEWNNRSENRCGLRMTKRNSIY